MMISEKINRNGKLENSERYKTLNINITGRCNEKCIYCQFSQCRDHEKGIDIDEELFYRVTKEAFDLGVTDVGLYTSGEPFLNRNIYKYISWCKKVGFPYVYISTNGLNCTLKNLKKVIEAGVDSLKFSIAGGTRENFLKHHGVDAFEMVKENIIQAYNYREKEGLNFKLYIFVIVTKYNIEEKEDIQKLFGPYVDEIIFSDCIDSTIPMIGVKEYLMPADQTKYLGGGGKQIPCPQLFNRIVVDEAGWLCACCSCSGKDYARVIDLRSKGLKEALNSEIMVNLRQRHLNQDVDGLICKTCVTGSFDEKNIHAFNGEFELNTRRLRPIDIREDIAGRFGLHIGG